MELNPKIRFATIFDLNGTITLNAHRDYIKTPLSYEESLRSLQQAGKSWKIRNATADKIGKGKFILAAYEKMNMITIPLDQNNLV